MHKLRGVAQQVLQQLRFESRARHPQPAELLRVDQAPCPVVIEDEAIFVHHLIAAQVLLYGYPVAYHLEDYIHRGHREAKHDQAPLARSMPE